MTSGTLYSCASPIGHLSDVSHRLLEILTHVDTIFCEDTRVSIRLMDRYDISTRLVSLQRFNEAARVNQIRSLLDRGLDAVLMSDAGTPGISDPGALLISYLLDNGYKVSPIPGPSAVTALLSASGWEASSFYFAGFFPRKEAETTRTLRSLSQLSCPLVFFESPKRLLKTLHRILSIDAHAELVLGKELTKRFETILRGPISEVIDTLAAHPIKGEWVFLLRLSESLSSDLADTVKDLASIGLDKHQIRHVMQRHLGMSRTAVYNFLQDYFSTISWSE